MTSVFSKRYITVPVAGFLISLGTNAMQEGQLMQQQYCAGRGLEKPSVSCGTATCIQTRNEATLSLVAGTTIHVRQLKTMECQLVQSDGDKASGSETVIVEKVCPPDNSQQNCEKGYQCGPLSAQPLSFSWETVSDGTKTGTATYNHLTEYEISLPAGDSWHRTLPCEKISAEQVLKGLPRELQHNFDIGETEDAIRGIIARLEDNNGTLQGQEERKGHSHSHSKAEKLRKK